MAVLIRHKLMLRFILLVLSIQLGFSASLYYFSAQARARRFEQRLTNSITLAARLLVRPHALGQSHLARLRPQSLLTLPDEEISIYSPNNTLFYASSGRIDQTANRAALRRVGPGQRVSLPAKGWRETVGQAVPAKGAAGFYRIFVSAEDRMGRDQLRQLRLLLVLANLSGLLLTTVAGWFFAGAALRPVTHINRQAGRLSATSLGHRISEGNGHDEVAQLAVTINTLLAGLEQTFEAQRSFLSHASHELRTPLTGLVGTLETALEYDATLPEARQSMAQSLEAARRLSALTNGLLNLARADGALAPFTPVRLDECLTQALQLMRAQYPGRDWKLTFQDLPAETEADPFTVPGNAELLTTALLNLLDNAGKYSSGPVRTEVAYPDRQTLRVSILDEGPGLTPEELKHIYEPLYRSANALSRPGYGLGLPLTQRIIQRHEGRLELTTVPGHGTTATVWLPAVTL